MKHPWITAVASIALAALAAACAHETAQTDVAQEPPGATDMELKTKLTPLQYEVTQNCGTEPPFRNAYWDNHEPGLYVDVVSGEPLFASVDKFDSGTGWPSFTKPLDSDAVRNVEDHSHGMKRVEVRSTDADSHLGHVFDDGPSPNSQRYCINSASLRFVHLRDLEKEGYGKYLELFPAELRAEVGSDKSDPGAKAGATRTETAILAGGCFWGVEDILRKLPGVIDTEVGYTGGHLENPRYDDTHDSKSGHAEAIRIEFDPARIGYGEILDTFFRLHDPTTLNRQGNDTGTQYRSAIFYLSDEQKKAAEEAKSRASSSGRWKRPVVTEIAAASTFWPAEDYHQDYLKKHPGGYTCHFLRD